MRGPEPNCFLQVLAPVQNVQLVKLKFFYISPMTQKLVSQGSVVYLQLHTEPGDLKYKHKGQRVQVYLWGDV